MNRAPIPPTHRILIAVFVFCAFTIITFLRHPITNLIKGKRPLFEREKVGKDILPLVLSFMNLFGLVVTQLYGDRIVAILTRLLGLYGMRALVASAVVCLGIGAHKWKQKNQYMYGMSEVIFGCAAVLFITFTITPEHSILSQWVGLGGSAYVPKWISAEMNVNATLRVI